MTAKDYRMISHAINAASERGEAVERVVEYLCLVLKQENERFNPGRFRKMCGLKETSQ